MHSVFSGFALYCNKQRSPLVSPMSLTPPTRKPSQSCYTSKSCTHFLLLPGGRKLLSALVVASETVNTALDENQTELGVAVLSVALQVLSHGHSLLDQEVHVLRNGRSQS